MRNNRKKKMQQSVIRHERMLCNESSFRIKEAYNLIRTKLMFTSKGEKCPIYAVTSSSPSEGKSINTINLAISFAMAGKKTLVIDADLRRPTINKYFYITNKPALSELLAKIQNEIQISPTDQENLFVLTSGSIPPNPAELLGNGMLGKILSNLSKKFDYIFIDTPPVGVVSDAALLAEYVTGYIIVVKGKVSEIPEVQYVVKTIQNINGNISGFILNDVEHSNSRYGSKYGYKYSYNYSYKKEETE